MNFGYVTVNGVNSNAYFVFDIWGYFGCKKI